MLEESETQSGDVGDLKFKVGSRLLLTLVDVSGILKWNINVITEYIFSV